MTDYVIDCGACVGWFVDLAICKYPNHTIIAFEPYPPNFKRLEEKYSETERVRVINAALCDFEGESDFFLKKYDDGFRAEIGLEGKPNAGSTLEKFKVNVSSERIRINVLKLSLFLEKMLDIENDNLILKIDVEGSEYKILNDLVRSPWFDRITEIFVEDHVNKIPFIFLERFKFFRRLTRKKWGGKYFEQREHLTYVELGGREMEAYCSLAFTIPCFLSSLKQIVKSRLWNR